MKCYMSAAMFGLHTNQQSFLKTPMDFLGAAWHQKMAQESFKSQKFSQSMQKYNATYQFLVIWKN